MTLLGANTGGFQMGVAGPPASSGMEMSLDEIIQQRRSSQQPKSVKKAVSNVDKTIGTGRAKRNAAMAARRGMQPNNKPTGMQIEQEVKKQAGKTAITKAKAATKTTNKPPTVAGGGAGPKQTPAEKAAARKAKREIIKQAKKAAVAVVRPPSKKQVAAAVSALQSAGFQIPAGQQMVISFAPIPGTAATTVKGPHSNPPNKNTSPPNRNTNPKKEPNKLKKPNTDNSQPKGNKN